MGDVQQHMGNGFTIDVPSEWKEQSADIPGVLFVAVEPEQEHPASVVVTAERPEGVASFADWQEKTETGLRARLSDYRLLDFRRIPLGEHDGVVRTASHSNDGTPITMMQFITAPGVTGWTVTASAPDWRFPELRKTFEEIGSSFRCEADA